MTCLIATEHVRAHAYDYAAFGRLIVPTLWLWNTLNRMRTITPLLGGVHTYAVVVEHP